MLIVGLLRNQKFDAEIKTIMRLVNAFVKHT